MKFEKIFLGALILIFLFIGISIVLKQTRTEKTIPVLIVPHFNKAEEKTREFLQKVSMEILPENIIFVSVNHFNSGSEDIITTDKKWNFQNSSPKINDKLFTEITRKGIAEADEQAFLNEHGIYNVLPLATEVFPRAKILPIIIKEKTSQNKIDKLVGSINQNCPQCLLIASIDFSHYNPNSLAQIHDEMSLSALYDLNEVKAWQAETDSPQSLYLAIKFAKERGTNNFNLFHHSNSGLDNGNDDIETTSYILGYFNDGSAQNQTKRKTTTFLIGGDLMLDRLVYHQFKDKGLKSVFDRFGKRVFWGVDLALLNLEGPMSSEPINDDPDPNNLIFNFPPQTVDALNFLKINTVSLANNHILNAGKSGLENTKNMLREAKIGFVGDPDETDETTVTKIEGGIPLSIIAVNQIGQSVDVVKDLIKKEKEGNRFVIVFPHWGNEYQSKHSLEQENLAHQWINEGADLIIGSHPHVIQDFEIYNSKPIIYSLGNFVFDQTFSKETQEGLLVGGIIGEDDISLSFFSTKQVNLMPELMRGEEKSQIINKLLDGKTGFTRINSDTIKLERNCHSCESRNPDINNN